MENRVPIFNCFDYITNFLWAVVFLSFILLAYLTPDTTYQVQDFEGQTQAQSSGSEVVTNGN